MSSYRLTLRIPEINQAAEDAFKETAFLLGREFTRVITQPRTWEGFEGSRDLIDTGQLRSSQQLVFTQPLEATFSWTTEYAVYVHSGYTLKSGKKIQGRPWTQIAISEFDVEGAFLQVYRRNLGT